MIEAMPVLPPESTIANWSVPNSGSIAGEAVELVKCRTVDIEVTATRSTTMPWR